MKRLSARRIGALLGLGCFGILALSLASSWIVLKVIQPSPTSSPGGELSWKHELGAHGPLSGPTEITPVPSPIGEFIFPGVLSVEAAVEWGDKWIVLDRRLGRVHVIHPTTGISKTLGRAGPGPGEFQEPVALAVQDSLLWILNQRGMALDRFSLDSGFQERRRIHGGGCLVGLAKELLFMPSKGLFLLRVCPATLPGPGSAWIERLDSEGELAPLLSLPLGDSGSRRIHFLRQPVMARGSGTVLLGTWDTPCIGEFDLSGELRSHYCLPNYTRPKTPASERSALEKRFSGISELGILPMTVPEHLPWFDRIFSTSRGLVVRRVRDMDQRDLVLLEPKGRPLQTDSLFPEQTFVGERSILTAEDLMQGTLIKIFENPWYQDSR